MSYPSVAFKPTVPIIGMQPIAETSTTQRHPLGTIVRAVDGTYGEGEFIYLAGVASTAAGDFACYNSKTGATVRAIHGGTGATGPGGVAMSANVDSQYGWYQVAGSGPVKAATVAANTPAYLTATAGQIDDASVAGDLVDGLLIKAADSGGFAVCQLDHPCVVGVDSAASSVLTGSPSLASIVSPPSVKVFSDSPVTMGAVFAYLCNATGGAMVMTLPAASAAAGRIYFVNKTDAAANNVTVTRAGSDTIEGATTVALTARYDHVAIISDGTATWFVISKVAT